MVPSTKPNYKKIYKDILTLKYPEKMADCQSLLSKARLTAHDILKINTLIFPQKVPETRNNSRHHSYDRSDILEMLDYQKKNRLNDSQLASHFKISRNTIGKWKKIFIV